MTYEERLALTIGRFETTEQDSAITSFVREHAAFIYRVAYSVLNDSHDAEDVTQETFIRVVKNVSQLPGIRDQRAWLARIAWRLAITRWNRTRQRRNMEVEGAEHDEFVTASSESCPESEELIEIVRRMTASLPDNLRHALVLSAIDEMSAREVAEILNISEGTVRTRVHRAKKILREKLGRLLGNDYATRQS